jgi:hypothetical protein
MDALARTLLQSQFQISPLDKKEYDCRRKKQPWQTHEPEEIVPAINESDVLRLEFLCHGQKQRTEKRPTYDRFNKPDVSLEMCGRGMK